MFLVKAFLRVSLAKRSRRESKSYLTVILLEWIFIASLKSQKATTFLFTGHRNRWIPKCSKHTIVPSKSDFQNRKYHDVK